MVRIVAYYFLMLAVVISAFRRGDWETRLAAVVCLAASLLSAFLINFKSQVAMNVAAIDLAVLAIFVALALRTRRFWPLWVAGLQLTTVMGHLLRVLQPQLLNIAYAASLRFWAYPILFIVMAAAWRSDRYAPRAPGVPG